MQAGVDHTDGWILQGTAEVGPDPVVGSIGDKGSLQLNGGVFADWAVTTQADFWPGAYIEANDFRGVGVAAIHADEQAIISAIIEGSCGDFQKRLLGGNQSVVGGLPDVAYLSACVVLSCQPDGAAIAKREGGNVAYLRLVGACG